MQKNFKETLVKSRLEIGIDVDYGEYLLEDLSQWDVGFVQKNSGIGEIKNMANYKEIVFDTKHSANSAYEHLELIKKELQKDKDNTKVFIVYKYEHGNVAYSLNLDTLPNCRFDTGIAGFLFVQTEEEAKDFIAELNSINENHYHCNLYDTEGNNIDSRSGLTSIQDVLDFLEDNGEQNTWTKEEIETMVANAI